MRACSLIGPLPDGRAAAVRAGLRAAGYALTDYRIDRPGPGDVLVCWSRRRPGDVEQAAAVERGGGTVLVAENGWLGKNWRGTPWMALSRGHHHGAGYWPLGSAARWDGWGVETAPWRDGGDEAVILAQRGIGEAGLACPRDWAALTQRLHGGRIRLHPGPDNSAGVPLSVDLQRAARCFTWNSGAALHALLAGVPVHYAAPAFVAAGAACRLQRPLLPDVRDDDARLAAFRRLAWSMWTLAEVASGEALRHVLA